MSSKPITEIITVDYLPPTLNDIVNVARSHYRAGAAQKKTWTDNMEELFKNVKPFEGEVFLEYVWYYKNSARDQDNITAAQKFILDGLAQSGAIHNDSLKYIKEPVIHWFQKSDFDGFTIIIRNEAAQDERFPNLTRPNFKFKISVDSKPPIQKSKKKRPTK